MRGRQISKELRARSKRIVRHRYATRFRFAAACTGRICCDFLLRSLRNSAARIIFGALGHGYSIGGSRRAPGVGRGRLKIVKWKEESEGVLTGPGSRDARDSCNDTGSCECMRLLSPCATCVSRTLTTYEPVQSVPGNSTLLTIHAGLGLGLGLGLGF